MMEKCRYLGNLQQVFSAKKWIIKLLTSLHDGIVE